MMHNLASCGSELFYGAKFMRWHRGAYGGFLAVYHVPQVLQYHILNGGTAPIPPTLDLRARATLTLRALRSYLTPRTRSR